MKSITKPTTVPVLVAKLREDAGGDLPTEGVEQQEQCLDRAVLNELAGGDAQMTQDILREFVEAARADALSIPSLRSRRDEPDLTRQAHRIKGAARMVGAMLLADVADRLEAAGRGADWPAIAETAPQIGERFTQLEQLLIS